jgi:hypothetical protein
MSFHIDEQFYPGWTEAKMLMRQAEDEANNVIPVDTGEDDGDGTTAPTVCLRCGGKRWVEKMPGVLSPCPQCNQEGEER